MDPIATKIKEAAGLASQLERMLAELAQEAGRGSVGLALNVAKTQATLTRGALLIALEGGSPVGSG